MIISLGLYQMYRNRSMHWYECSECKEITIGDLASFKIRKSCGCRKLKTVKHGHFTDGKESPTYLSWRGVKNRCLNKKNIGYTKYGGAGITFDPKWETFEGFLEDMGERPEGRTLDRIDNCKGYSKENCRWATKLQQTQNRKITVRLKIVEGLEMTAKEISDVIGLGPSYVSRLIKQGKGDEVRDKVIQILDKPRGYRGY